ncbi:nucleoside-diphosphate sugar epimerase/dehydratase [Candidatus Lucifugimonas marina]|uniref:NAD-dependent epimerase/dehydratase family protein n=1 Tax=Candidatus Lucifugimonas marina TaxID=3038979 RepID=A0AAJ5ZCH0_9CHLR|nr:NAD-dependent epimerase/dehydratase family protein [SAR202 cluster bacterium JH702]MDG0868237.1 NAD-dependent epimerase/dehydratase family protein [SAR202 cluster bacterium JH639]WFG34881.1 NAD-dependent epimerase/dehydratase family protein [SAR202 cluster bacterium JH545]WFG38832.1 NAD-dependent epimerase/dehydratase family protein [SAR202 cluster bacterium JH1073]
MSLSNAIQRAVPSIPKRRRLFLGLAVQAILPAISLYVALMLRLDLDESRIVYSALVIWIPVLIGLRLVALIYFNAHTGLWRYVSVPDLIAVAKSTTAATVVFGVVGLLIIDPFEIPRSVYLIEWGVHIFLAGGLRMAVRIGRERLKDIGQDQSPKRRVVMIGAGDAGAAFCAQIKSTPEFRLEPVAVLDDDPSKIGQSLIGVPVIGSIDTLSSVVKKYEADIVVIAIPAATTEQRSRIINACREAQVEFRILPGTDELLEGNVSISKLRRVDVADLLGRPETHLDEAALRATFTGKTVMITGGAGTIGSELARRVIAFEPATLILIDRSENPLVLLEYELRAQIKEHGPEGINLVARIADVTEPVSIRSIMTEHSVDVVLHAAAHKHVYLMEDAPADAVYNNVGGVLNVARAAQESGASTFVLVSTDKAVSPTSVMGATKRMAELAIRELGAGETTHFAAVRFGNVLGSNGSVIPIFQQQIESGGPVTVTHPEAERYFMTAHEAAGLILTAAAIGDNQEIYLLDMGTPVSIDSLARTMIELSGMVPDKDINIEYSGLKTGEKLTEILSSDQEELGETANEKLMLVRNTGEGNAALDQLDEFISAVRTLTDQEVKDGIRRIVPDYNENGNQ